LPALVAIVVGMLLIGRPSSAADTQGVQLPAQQSYAVQQEAPLFAKAQPTETTESPAAPNQSIGVQDASGLGFDLADIGLKLIVVLALAYGSLMLLKRAGFGGDGSAGSGGPTPVMRVVSSLALAPNRSVHVIKVPGGKTLLVGATPSAVNLLADLGELADDDTPEAASFLDAIKGKIGS
jgi:flagellar biogenesis protein FliO